MEVYDIRDQPGLEGLAGDWDRLLRAYGQGTVQSSYSWIRQWWDFYGRDRKLRILVAREGAEAVGIAPLCVCTTRAVKGLANRQTLCFMGQGSSDYADFIVPHDHERVMKAFVDHLQHSVPGWDRMDLWEVREDSPNLDAFTAAATACGWSCIRDEGTLCHQVETTRSWDEYYEGRFKGKFRSDVRRRRAKLEKLGPVTLDRSKVPDETLWDELVSINRKHLVVKGKQDLTGNLDFLKSVGARLGADGLLDVATLRVDKALVAYNIGFSFAGTVSHWKVGYDPDYRTYAPGRLLIRFLLEACHGDETTMLDFMRGDEDYKKVWSTTTRRNVYLTVRNDRVSSRVKSLIRRNLSQGGATS